MNSMLVPAILVTVGLLWLLDNLHAIYFHRSWPIILIVLGSIKVLQSSASTEGHRAPAMPAEVVATPAAVPGTSTSAYSAPSSGSTGQSDEGR
jgi:hypothetical protein